MREILQKNQHVLKYGLTAEQFSCCALGSGASPMRCCRNDWRPPAANFCSTVWKNQPSCGWSLLVEKKLPPHLQILISWLMRLHILDLGKFLRVQRFRVTGRGQSNLWQRETEPLIPQWVREGTLGWNTHCAWNALWQKYVSV